MPSCSRAAETAGTVSDDRAMMPFSDRLALRSDFTFSSAAPWSLPA